MTDIVEFEQTHIPSTCQWNCLGTEDKLQKLGSLWHRFWLENTLLSVYFMPVCLCIDVRYLDVGLSCRNPACWCSDRYYTLWHCFLEKSLWKDLHVASCHLGFLHDKCTNMTVLPFMPHLLSWGPQHDSQNANPSEGAPFQFHRPCWPRAHVNIQSITSLTGRDNLIKWKKNRHQHFFAPAPGTVVRSPLSDGAHYSTWARQELREAQNQWDVISSDVPRTERESEGGMCHLHIAGECVTTGTVESQTPEIQS